MGQEREARKEDINRRDGKPGDGGIRHTKRKRGGWWSLCCYQFPNSYKDLRGQQATQMLLSASQRVYGGIVWERLASETRTFRGNEEQFPKQFKEMCRYPGLHQDNKKMGGVSGIAICASILMSICLSVFLSVVHQRSRRVKMEGASRYSPLPSPLRPPPC